MRPDRPFSSWFLAAFPRHKIVERLKETTDELWHTTDDPASKDYFWFHKLFGSLLQTDREIAQLWEMSTEVLADAPHFLQFVGLTNPATADVEFHIHNKLSNVYKLTRCVELPIQIQGTVLDTLFRTL
jgi:Capsular polysaccharide synthesis protein